MSAITTHVLDTALGRPAADLEVALLGNGRLLGKSRTDADGRIRYLATIDAAGDYELEFDVGPYFAAQQVESFYPAVRICFTVKDATQHYHVPLLLSPFGYSTYRGS